MDIITYALSKKIAAHALSGVQSMSVSGQTLTINTKDSGVLTITFPTPKDGVSVTDIDVNANNQIVFTMSDGSEIISGKIPTVKGDKGDPGFSPTITENADNTDKIYKLDITTADSTFTTPNLKGADGQGGTGGGEENKIDSISVNGTPISIDENKNVDITVPSIEGLTKDEDLAAVAKSGDYGDLINKPTIPSLDGYAKTTEIPSKVSELENDSNYLSSIPDEYVTDTELEAKGYLTEHQDISGKVDKVEGKSLISDTEIARLASVDNYDDTDIKAEIANKADTTSIPSKVSVLENDSKYQTESDVTTTLTDYATKTYVGEQITNAEHLKREIVTVLPSDIEASDNIIYMLKVESATGNDKYQEYMKIDGTVQMVGDTSVDLTDYAKSVDIPTTVAELTDSADYAKKTDLHSHTNKTILDGITEEKVTAWDKAQENVIETVKVNDQEITPDENKAVNIDLSNYAEHDEIVGENLIPFPYADGMSKTMNGIEYTVNPDGSVTAVGTATETSAFVLAKYLNIDPNTTYILSGDLDDEITYKSSAILFNAETNSGTSYWNYGKDEPVIFTGISVMANFRIRISKDETVNQTFYPMLELGTIAHKYQPYNLSREALRTDIADVTELASRVDNQFATATGNNITVNDSVDGNIVELGVKGNSFQQTYSGYNLLPYPFYQTSKTVGNITVTDNKDGSITINGTNGDTSVNVFDYVYRNHNFKAGTYHVSGVGRGWIGAYTTGTTNPLYTSQIYNGEITFTVDTDFDLLLRSTCDANGSYDNVTYYPMIVKVADDNSYPTEYEAYCGGVPSPNPSYPQTINSVGDDGSLVVKSRGKNMIPFPYYSGMSFVYNGITTSVNSDGSLKLNGVSTANSVVFRLANNDQTIKIPLEKKKYVIKYRNEANMHWRIDMGILKPDNTYDVLRCSNIYSVIDNTNGTYLGIFAISIYFENNIEVNNYTIYPMLVEVNKDGTYPTEYEPYKSSTSTIPLSEPLRAIGDVKDEITYQDGKWGVLRRIGKYVVDSSTDIKARTSAITDKYRMSTTEISSKAKVVADNNTMPKMLCSHYNVVTTSDVWYCNGGITIDTKGDILVYDERYNTSDATLYKTWVSDNPVTITYELATPVFEPFADQTLPYLSTYDGVTNISNDDVLSAEMTVKYPTTDVSGVGSRNESRIAELAKDTDDKFDDVNESLSVIGKCKNLLNPTLQTTTQNGVTCTNNGDGTYTLNGTASSQTTFVFAQLKSSNLFKNGITYKFCGCPKLNNNIWFVIEKNENPYTTYVTDYGNGGTFTYTSNDDTINIFVRMNEGIVLNNVVLKPMLTTDLNATYDDFVPYTGDGDTLTHDVAKVSDSLDNLSKGGINLACNFMQGGMSGNIGSQYITNDTSNRCRTDKRYLSDITSIIPLSIPSSYRVGIASYNSSDVMIADSGWLTGTVDYERVENTSYITIVVSKTDNTDITPQVAEQLGIKALVYNFGEEIDNIKKDLGGLSFSASGTTLSITDGTHTWTLEANS